MNLITIALAAVIVLVVLGIVLAFVLPLWLDWKVFDIFMDAGTGKGPLEVRAAADDTHITLTITNHGSNKMRLNAVEGRDASGTRVFPVPMLPHDGPLDNASRMKQFARIALAPGESTTIMLDRQELDGMQCQSIGIRAGDKLWPANDLASLGLSTGKPQ